MPRTVWERCEWDCEALEVALKAFCLEATRVASEAVEAVLRMTIIIKIMELRPFAASFISHSKFYDLIKLFRHARSGRLELHKYTTNAVSDESSVQQSCELGNLLNNVVQLHQYRRWVVQGESAVNYLAAE